MKLTSERIRQIRDSADHVSRSERHELFALAFRGLEWEPYGQAVHDALMERERQDAKWGPQDHPLPVWLAILMEEVGELSECVLHAQFGGPAAASLRKEVVQVAAVALAIVQALDDGRAWTLPRTPDGHTAGKPLAALDAEAGR